MRNSCRSSVALAHGVEADVERRERRVEAGQGSGGGGVHGLLLAPDVLDLAQVVADTGPQSSKPVLGPAFACMITACMIIACMISALAGPSAIRASRLTDNTYVSRLMR